MALATADNDVDDIDGNVFDIIIPKNPDIYFKYIKFSKKISFNKFYSYYLYLIYTIFNIN